MSLASIAVVKILFLSVLSFVVTFALTPALTHFLYKYKLGKHIRNDGERTPIFSQLHKHKAGTPTMGGVLVWVTTLIITVLFFYLPALLPQIIPAEFNFLTRSETLLPLGVLVASALVGLADDIFEIKRQGTHKGGFRMRHRVMLYSAIAAVAVYWFYVKLDWTIFHIPFQGTFDLAWWAIPVYFLVIVATSFSVNETDGLDGLAGGVLLSSFGTYAAIAFVQGNYDLATFCAVIGGSLLAFLWFNIHPARFFMGDTGAMSLGVTLAVVGILTDTVWLLPIIGIILVIESGSVLLQWGSKWTRRGKKLFRSSPIHHHFEAIGWEEPKIVMRFWIISGVAAVFGIVFFLIDRSVLG